MGKEVGRGVGSMAVQERQEAGTVGLRIGMFVGIYIPARTVLVRDLCLGPLEGGRMRGEE